MALHFSIDDATGIAIVTAHGNLSFGDVIGALDDLVRRGAFTRRRRLWDLRGARVEITSGEVKRLAETYQSFDSAERQRLAIVSSEDLAFGMARMFEAYRESKTVEVQVFRDLDAARDWLLEDF